MSVVIALTMLMVMALLLVKGVEHAIQALHHHRVHRDGRGSGVRSLLSF